MLLALGSAHLPARNDSARRGKNGALAAELLRPCAPASGQRLQANQRARSAGRRREKPSAADAGKASRASAAGTVFAWRTRGYGLMISRLHEMDCAPRVRVESAAFSQQPGVEFNSGRR